MSHILLEGEHQGFKFRIMHNGYGFRCGYVGIPAHHPWHGMDPFKIEADVHGGVNFGQLDQDGTLWIGFDCYHITDLPDPELPGSELLVALYSAMPGRTRNRMSIKSTEYVRRECVRLCEQAAQAMSEFN